MSSRQVSTALITIPLALCVVFLGFGVLTLPRLSEGGTYALVVFLIFPAVAAAVLVVLLRLHHPLRDKIIISLTATLLTLYAIEMGITWLNPDTVDEFQGSRAHIQEVDRLRGEGLKATLNVTPKGLVGNRKPKIGSDEALPLGGVANSVVVLCDEIGKWITYESDENGFANPPGLYEKESLDIIVVGDSFAHGFCIEPDDTIVGVVRRAYPDTLNLGMSGSGPLVELAGIVEYASQYRPRVVLWMYYEGNDLEDLVKERKDKLLVRYLEDTHFTQALLKRRDQIQSLLVILAERAAERERISPEVEQASFSDRVWRFRNHWALEFLTYNNLSSMLKISPGKSETGTQEDVELLGQILKRANTEAESWGGELYFVYLCQKSRFGLFTNSTTRELVLDEVDRLGLPIVDGCSVFSEEPNPQALYQGHYTPEGASLVGNAILDALK